MSQPSLDLDLDFDDGGEPTYTVGELTSEINGALRRRFTEGVWVRGEIHGWNEGRNGHVYFNLVEDGDDGKATIAVAFFRNAQVRLTPMLRRHRLRLGDGMKVRIHGFLDLYGPTGRLSLKMGGIDPRYTLGEMALARDQVVRRLVAEGLYDANRALRLPTVPLRVGVVSSVGSAAWHDFTDELRRSGFGFRLRVVDVHVQGDWAVGMITAAVRTLSASVDLDVIVVIRGGGSRTDLAAFDADAVARAIAASRVPVLTGLGHEIDRSIADEVAHLALKTPTACAGELIGRVAAFSDRADELWAAVAVAAGRRLARAGERLDTVQHRVDLRTRGATELASERLSRLSGRIPAAARQALAWQQARVERAVGRVGPEARRHLGTRSLVLDGLEGRLRALDPVATMARGWTITRTADGRLVRSPDDAGVGEELVTTTAGGEIRSTVTEV